MDYVKLASTGLTVSRLCLGCMTYGAKSWRQDGIRRREHVYRPQSVLGHV